MSNDPGLRVAVEATSLLGPRTGVGTMTDALIQRLAQVEGVELTGVLVSFRGRGFLDQRLPEGVESIAVAFPARLAHRLWQRVDFPALKGFDLVHGPNFVVPPAKGGAELVTIHDFGPWHTPDLVTSHAQAYPDLVTRALGRGAHVHVVSEFVAGEAEDILGLERDRIHVVHNGFDAGGSGGDSRAGRSMAGGSYVLSIGTIEPRKDLPTLVEAMGLLWDEGHDLRLVVAGADGWGTAAFDSAVAGIDRAQRDRVVRLGYVSDVERSDLLAGAGCLAFPSLYEGFGLPPLEAMAHNCPVVTTTAGSLPEICGPAALFVEPGDATSLAAAVASVTGDEPVAQRLIAAGKKRLESYSWDRSAAAMVGVYRATVDAARS